MLQAYDYASGQPYVGVEGPEGLELLGPEGLELLGPEGLELLGPYDIGLMEATEVKDSLVLDKDVKCDMAKNVCTPVTEAAKAQIMALQSALNRAIDAYTISWKKLELNGIVDPDTITTAWTVAKKIGPEAHPVLKEIADVDITNLAEIGAIAQRLATAPVGIQNVFDDLSAKAVKTEVEVNGAAKKRKMIYWVIGALALAGVATGVVIYSRKPALAAR